MVQRWTNNMLMDNLHIKKQEYATKRGMSHSTLNSTNLGGFNLGDHFYILSLPFR